MRIYYADYNLDEATISLKEITSDLIKAKLVECRITKENVSDGLFQGADKEIIFKTSSKEVNFQTAIARLFDTIKKLPENKKVFLNEHF